jgi:hypothetical protein
MAMPAATFGATPNWEVTGAQTLPPTVEEDSVAGYAASIRNNGPSNISQLSVTVFFQQPFVAADDDEVVNPGAPGDAALFARVVKNGVTLAGACPATLTEPLVCNVGPLGAGGVATITVAYQTEGAGQAGIHGWWQSNGTGSTFCTPGDNSQGDCLPLHVGPTGISNDGNFGGGFSVETGGVANTDGISASNLVSTTLTAPNGQKNLILTVADETALTDNPACTGCIAGTFTTELHVGDGSAAFGLSKVVIDYHKNLWKTANFKKLTVVHIHDDLTSHEISFSNSCSGTTECATFGSLAGGHGRVTLYLAQNGWVKYH